VEPGGKITSTMYEPGAESDPLGFFRWDLQTLLRAVDEAAADGDAELAANVVALIYRAFDREHNP